VKAQATGAAIAFLIGHAAPGLAESLSGELAGPANFKDAVAALARCGKKVDSDAVCRAMRYRVLDVVAEDVVTLGASRHPPDRALLVKMLRRPEVQLRAAAADAFGIGSPAKDEVGPLVEALNDPVPLVRRKVGRAIRNLSDPRALAAAERMLPASERVAPDAPIDMAALGVRAYPGAAYIFFSSSSDEGRVEFSTSDAPAKVVDFYKAAAKKAPMAIEEFGRVYAPGASPANAFKGAMPSSGQPSAEQMAKMMEMAQQVAQQMARDTQGKSPEEAQRAITQGAAAAHTPLPVERYSKVDFYGAPRVVVLGESVFMGASRPSLYLVIFEDKVLGKTGIAVHSATTR
jgi:HEAT repeats